MNIIDIIDNDVRYVHAFNFEGLIQAMEDGHIVTALVVTNVDKYDSYYDYVKELHAYYELLGEFRFNQIYHHLIRLKKFGKIFVVRDGKDIPILYIDEIESLLGDDYRELAAHSIA